MITLAVIIIYVLFLTIAVCYVWRYHKLIFSSFLGAYVLSFFALNYVGLAILYFQLDRYRFEIGINDPVLLSKMLIFSILAFVTVICTYSFLNPKLSTHDVAPIMAKRQEKYLFAGFVIFSAFTVFQYVRDLNGIALLLALYGDFDGAMVARSDMSNNHGSLHMFRLGLQQLPMILFYFAYLSMQKPSFLHKAILVGLFGIVAFLLALSTEKFAVIQFIIGLLFLRTKYVRRITFRGWVACGVAVIMIITFFYMFFSGFNELDVVLRVAASRIFTGSIGTAHFYLEYFPEVHPFLYGRSLPNPMGIFPWEPFSPAVEIMNWKFPAFLEKNIVGSSPSTFWAEGYANFGVFGVIVSALYLGTFLAVTQPIFTQYNSFLFVRAVEGWFFTYIFAVNISGVSEYLKVTVLIPLIALLILPRVSWR